LDVRGRFAALGQAMRANAEAQRVIEIAESHGALGWKVNGEGGSLKLLCGPLSHTRRAMIREIEEESPLFQNIPIYLSRFGLRVWETRPVNDEAEPK